MRNLPTLFFYFLFSLILACGSPLDGQQRDHKFTNELIHSNSPYLLQHAHNPVNWYPWGEAALEKAKTENKMLLISVGYAACHWCHVMEHESFEDTTVARIMNEHFVSIKVDREERPDIDAIYMTACQMASDGGCGWPLNSFALPDGRPVWAGTYFARKQWIEILQYFIDLREKSPEKLEDFASRLASGMQKLETIEPAQQELTYDTKAAVKPLDDLLADLDPKYGGRRGVQKFPMPSYYEWLLQAYSRTGREDALDAVRLSLNKMQTGGIYDQLQGGFARYATDSKWQVPHFEKMLYDNAQLISLYARAYQLTGDETYRQTMEQSLAFVQAELADPNGGFYSSLDADSEGEEGKFYVWTEAEIDSLLLPAETQLVNQYYDITSRGNWEAGKNVLRIASPLSEVAEQLSLSLPEAEKLLESARTKLLDARNQRTRPALDDKVLTSWNALMLQALTQAYRATGQESYRKSALHNAEFLSKYLLAADFRLQRNYKDGKTAINGFLDDYAHCIQAFTGLYEITFDERWLTKARGLADYSIQHFRDTSSGFFFYTSDLDPPLLVRKIDLSDNVIPASNSALARALLHLGHYFPSTNYLDITRQMMNGMQEKALNGKDASYYPNWNQLYLELAYPIYEVAIVGPDFEKLRQEIQASYAPQAIYLGGPGEGSLALLEGKLVPNETYIYVCLNKVCKLPVDSAAAALELMK